MKQSWLEGLTPEQATIMKSDFKGSLGLRRRLEEISLKKIKASNTNARKKENYALASWSCLQADAIGYERALFEIISLISDDFVEKG
jgi:hypothetical protein